MSWRGVLRSGLALAALSPVNPFLSPAMRSWIGGRAGRITAAVEDLHTRQTWVLHPGVAEHTASIVKVDILETLLHELHGAPLPAGVAATAQGMIEHSDNDDATALWNRVGGAPAVASFDRLVGMSQTSPAPSWGLTTTTALDQVQLLRELVQTPSPLDLGARDYELSLMSHIEGDQAWGVSGGVPPGVAIALKNGWLPLPGEAWQVNSIGRIDGNGRDYLIAVLTSGDPSMAYGIGTIEQISSLVWDSLDPQVVGRLTVPAPRKAPPKR